MNDHFQIEMEDGVVFTFKDPKAINLNELVTLESLAPIDQIKAMMGEGEFAALLAHPQMTGDLVISLLRRYTDWLKSALGNIAPGELLERDMSDEHFDAVCKAYAPI